MTSDAAPTPLRSQPAVRAYTVFCLTALMAMVLALIENERDLFWAFFLAAIGAVGVIARWRAGPPLVLLGLVVLEVVHGFMGLPYATADSGWGDSVFMDAVLAAAVLAYAAGHYRLLSLVHTAFPIDPRRPPPRRDRDGRRAPPPDGRRRRSAGLPGPWELPLLGIVAGLWAVGVSLFWLTLSAAPPPRFVTMEMMPEAGAQFWHGLLLVLLVGMTMAVLAGAVAYLSWATAPPEEHLVYLQDVAWRETRREQNRINRWMTWARLRTQRRKEQT